jgi:hypothetical protein
MAPARDVASLPGVGLRIVDTIDLHYCADCGERINLLLLLHEGRVTEAIDPEALAARNGQELRLLATYRTAGVDAVYAARKLQRITESPRIYPGACPACGGGRVARRIGED